MADGTGELLTYDDFKPRIGNISLRTVKRQISRGDFPAGIRFSAGSTLYWSKAQIDAHVARVMAGLEAPK